jgi:hypothetical protein
MEMQALFMPWRDDGCTKAGGVGKPRTIKLMTVATLNLFSSITLLLWVWVSETSLTPNVIVLSQAALYLPVSEISNNN